MGLGRLFRRRPRSFSTPAEGDRMILDMLRLQGADLSVRVEASAAGDGTWLALATGERVVDEATVDGVRARFDQVAGEHGGEYDGWEAAAS
jgi:hypothetical protein